ncbi:baseplate assembly protein [Shewanella dokdonensis]|nr:baseplate J/gp47 family protein [Shewanella dokdonensis]MCL1075984.1 baseplate J/gp47 family protein [Shewanella dokdonensis]
MSVINLNQLPSPNIIEAIDYETILSEMTSALIGLDPSLGEVLALDSEPLNKLLQIVSYREMLLRQRVNEAAKAVMLAYALDADLDNLAALLGVKRLVIDAGDPTAATPIPPTYEEDEPFRQRILLSLDGLSVAGPARAYIYHALSADGRVLDASVESPQFTTYTLPEALAAQLPSNVMVLQCTYDAGLPHPRPGDVAVTVLSREGNGEPSSELVDMVNTRLSGEDLRPLTDNVYTRSATIVNYRVDAQLYTFAGPDPTVVVSSAITAVKAYINDNRRLGRSVTLSGLYAALHVGGVQRVELRSPTADVHCSINQAAFCDDIQVVYGGIAQ